MRMQVTEQEQSEMAMLTSDSVFDVATANDVDKQHAMAVADAIAQAEAAAYEKDNALDKTAAEAKA